MLHVTNMFFSPHGLHNAHWLVDSSRAGPRLTPLARGGSVIDLTTKVTSGEGRGRWDVWDYSMRTTEKGHPGGHSNIPTTRLSKLPGQQHQQDVSTKEIHSSGEYVHLRVHPPGIECKTNTSSIYGGAFPSVERPLLCSNKWRWPWSGGVSVNTAHCCVIAMTIGLWVRRSLLEKVEKFL